MIAGPLSASRKGTSYEKYCNKERFPPIKLYTPTEIHPARKYARVGMLSRNMITIKSPSNEKALKPTIGIYRPAVRTAANEMAGKNTAIRVLLPVGKISSFAINLKKSAIG
jgi:hypothetical protein